MREAPDGAVARPGGWCTPRAHEQVRLMCEAPDGAAARPWGWCTPWAHIHVRTRGRGTSLCHLPHPPGRMTSFGVLITRLRLRRQRRTRTAHLCAALVRVGAGLAGDRDAGCGIATHHTTPRSPARPAPTSEEAQTRRSRGRAGVSWQRPWMAAVASAHMDVRPSG